MLTPNMICVPCVKLYPKILTSVPPATGPSGGVIFVIVGAVACSFSAPIAPAEACPPNICGALASWFVGVWIGCCLEYAAAFGRLCGSTGELALLGTAEDGCEK